MQLRVNMQSPGRPGRFVGVLFGLVFLTVGLIFTAIIGNLILKRMEIRLRWGKTSCEILSCEADTSGDGSSPYRLLVLYSYRFEGGRYTGHVLRPDDQGWDDFRPVQLRLLKYRKGSRHPCWVDPGQPENSVLERGNPFFSLLIFFPLIFVAIGATVIVGSLRSRSGKQIEELGTTGMDPERKRRAFRLVFLLLAAGSILALGLMRHFLFGPIETRSWKSIPAEVRQSALRKHEGTDSDGHRSVTWKIDILYAYEYDGQPYRSNHYSFFTGSSSGRSAKDAILRRYPPGKKIKVWVDPDDPTRAVINRDWSALQLLGLIPLLMLAVGVAGMARFSRPSRQFSGTFEKSPAEDTPAAGEGVPTGSRGPLVLRPGKGRMIKIVALLIFSLFWNGIISLFLVQVIRAFRSGHPDWFLTLFMSPFVVAGIGFILAFFHSLLALANPKTTLHLESSHIRLGEQYNLRWELSGNLSRLENFRIVLSGSEKATYRRGTTTHTDTEEFRRIVIHEAPGSAILQEGNVTLEIPGDTMHTFKASNNQIIWQLMVEADIPRWPDISDSWEIPILPRAEAGENEWNI